MSVSITDNGNLLDITVAGEKHSLPKNSIELNVWDGHLLIWSFMRERYKFAYSDIIEPISSNAEDLRDKIAAIINNDEISENIDNVNLKLYNSNDKFDLMLEELMEIKKILKKIYA